MKHYAYTPEGTKQVPEDVLISCRAQGGFMSKDGPVRMPMKLGKPEADGVGELLKKGKNFVFWFSPDFRVVFITKDGAIDSAGKWWKIRFEWRSVSKTGEVAASIARFDRRVPPDVILPALENAFDGMAQKIAAAHAAEAEKLGKDAPQQQP